jgi:hypothetical protein
MAGLGLSLYIIIKTLLLPETVRYVQCVVEN